MIQRLMLTNSRVRLQSGFEAFGRMPRSAKMVGSLFTGFAMWEIVGQLTSPLILATFSDSVIAFVKAVSTGELIRHTVISFTELAIGFVIGFVVGLVGGLLSAVNRTFRDMTDPWIAIKYTTPTIALIPLLVVWLGFGMPAVIALVFLAVFVPIWLNTYIGVTSTDPHLLEVMRTFGASRLQMLRWVILPWALPSLIVGIRLAFSRGFVAVIIGEFIGSTAGLGYFISVAAGFYQTEKIMAGVMVLAGITIIMVELLKWMQRGMVPWWETRESDDSL